MWRRVIGKTIEFVWKPQCTEHPPVHSWYPPQVSPSVLIVSPSVLMVSSSELNTSCCTHIPHHGTLAVLMVSPTVLNISWCTHDIPQCTEHPRCAAHTFCTAQTLCMVIFQLKLQNRTIRLPHILAQSRS